MILENTSQRVSKVSKYDNNNNDDDIKRGIDSDYEWFELLNSSNGRDSADDDSNFPRWLRDSPKNNARFI